MTTAPFNKLTPAEAERLAMLIEECGEVIQAATKILRHGYDSKHPDNEGCGPDNRDDLFREIVDLTAVEELMHLAGDIPPMTRNKADAAIRRKLQYAHHQRQDQ